LAERTLVTDVYINTAITQRPIALAALVDPSGRASLVSHPRAVTDLIVIAARTAD
jgi:hypothetical protein